MVVQLKSLNTAVAKVAELEAEVAAVRSGAEYVQAESGWLRERIAKLEAALRYIAEGQVKGQGAVVVAYAALAEDPECDCGSSPDMVPCGPHCRYPLPDESGEEPSVSE